MNAAIVNIYVTWISHYLKWLQAKKRSTLDIKDPLFCFIIIKMGGPRGRVVKSADILLPHLTHPGLPVTANSEVRGTRR